MPEGWGVPKINGPSRPEAKGPLLKEHLQKIFKSWCLSLHKRKLQSFLHYQMGMGTRKYKTLVPMLENNINTPSPPFS